MANSTRISRNQWIDILGVTPESSGTKLQVQDACRQALQTALEFYFAHTRLVGKRLKRPHRATARTRRPPAHRPNDAVRHGFIGDVFDAYMTLRNDDLKARGFKTFATALFRELDLPLRITDHDMVTLRTERARFVKHVTKHWKT